MFRKMMPKFIFLAILFVFFINPSHATEPMRFERIERCASPPQDLAVEASCVWVPPALGSGPLLLAYGQITRQTDEHFGEISATMPAQTIVVFQSLGGDVIGSLRLGQAIRARGFNTYLTDSTLSQVDPKTRGKCYSACAYAFLGGSSRGVDEGGKYGVHQFRGQGTDLNAIQTQKLSAVLGRYLDAMMVNRQLLDQAMLTDPGKVNLIPANLRQAWRVENSSPTGNAALSRWRIEVASGGKKLAFVVQRQKASGALLTLAFARLGDTEKITALLIVRPDPSQEGNPDWLTNFNSKIPVLVEFSNELTANTASGKSATRKYELMPVSNWMVAGTANTPGTRQIWLATSPQFMAQLGSVDQFTVKPLWPVLPRGLDEVTVFGTAGFSDTLKAL
jgi:hypothetical protein